MLIERLDPMDLDLDTADALAALTHRCNRVDGVPLPDVTGPTLLRFLQLQSDGRPVDALWVARNDQGRPVGRVTVAMPRRTNLDTAVLRGCVAPEVRRRGLARELLEEVVTLVDDAGRTKVYASAFDGSPGVEALPALGFEGLGTVDAVRRIDVHGTRPDVWQRLYDEAAKAASAYELVRLVGPTPDDMLDGLVDLHAAINDAPLDDPDLEGDTWSAQRVASYDAAMAGRRQTVHRVLARHRDSGAWAGMSMLCVDEFAPTLAFQEDTSVVRTHRGHRLGLLMKADMLRWLTEERSEIGAVDTWNSTTNHHMIAVNERLGASVIARNTNYRLARG